MVIPVRVESDRNQAMLGEFWLGSARGKSDAIDDRPGGWRRHPERWALVSLLDPEVIILAGGMAAVADLYVGPLQKAMFERAQPLAAHKVKIAVSKLGDTVSLLGCARLAWEPAVRA